MNKEIDNRLYFFVLDKISNIQKGIGMGKAALKYFIDKEYLADEYEPWLVLNVSSNKHKMNDIKTILNKHAVDYTSYKDPNLNNTLTIICLLVDERVYNINKYPDWDKDNSEVTYDRWVSLMGGQSNIVLRELINKSKFGKYE